MRKLILTLLIASSPALAGTDLRSAWLAARNNDPAWQGDLAGARAGALKEKQAKALWLPVIGLQAGTGFADMKNQIDGAQFSAPGLGSMNNASFITDANNGYETHWGIVASQPVYNAERSANASQLTQQARLALLQLQVSEHELFIRVAQRYFDVLIAEDALQSLQAQKRTTRQLLDIATAKFNIGKNVSTDMYEAEASLDAVVAQEYALQGDLELKSALFTGLTGLSAANLARLGQRPRLESLSTAPLQELISQAMMQSPQIQISTAGKQIIHLEMDKYKAMNATTVDLVAQYGQQKINGSGNSSSTAAHSGWIGLQIGIPLFTGGMRSAKYEEAIANNEKADHDVARIKRQVSEQIRAAYVSLNSGLQQIRALERGLISAQSKLDSTQTGQEAGARTTTDVLNAQQACASAQTYLSRMRYQVLLAVLSLAAASGDLSEIQLDKVNRFLSEKPSEHER